MVKLRIILALVAALGLSGALLWGFWHRGNAQVAAQRIERLEADLEASRGTVKALEEALVRKGRVDAAQSRARAEAQRPVQEARTELEKNDEARPTGTPRQLDSLRDLAAAGNRAVRGAGKLP